MGAKFTPGSGTLTAYLAPFSGKASCAHYGLFVTQAGEVWVTILAENGLAPLDIKAMNAINPLANSRMGKVWMGYDPQSRSFSMIKVPARCPRQAPLLCCSSVVC